MYVCIYTCIYDYTYIDICRYILGDYYYHGLVRLVYACDEYAYIHMYV